MTDFNFDFVDRYDEELAEEGRKFEVFAENGKRMAGFTAALFSYENRKVKLAQERIRRKYAKDLRVKGDNDNDLNERIAREVFVESVLLDWDVTNGGKPVPYSKEAALAYFSHEKGRYVFAKLLGEASEVNNFQAEDREEVAGN